MSSSTDAISLYPYDPSKPLPIVFASIIFLLGLCIFYQSWRYSWTHFSFMVTWASLVWLGGFIVRAISVSRASSIPLFITQYVLIFTGPPLYAASEYFILGRLLAYLPYHSPLHPGRVLSTFLVLSAIVESLAASGAATVASANAKPSARTSAVARIEASLILQEIVEIGFMSLVLLVERRCRRAGCFPYNVRVICRVLYATSLMMTVRCAVRIAEGFEAATCDPASPGYDGYCGPIQTQEWYLWVFEVANVTVFVAVLAMWHPGRFLPSDKNQYLDPRDGAVERVGPGYSSADQRSWAVTVLDPFDFAGATSGRGPGFDRFWERDNPVASTSIVGGRWRKSSPGVES